MAFLPRLYYGMSQLLSVATPLLKPLERVPKKISQRTVTTNPVFIVGAPRTGSTSLYLYLTRHYAFNYLSNYNYLLPENPILAQRLRSRWHDSFHRATKAQHGVTFDAGIDAPFEGGNFWRRYFPKDIQSLPQLADYQHELEALQKVVQALKRLDNRTLLVKNLALGKWISVLHGAFPMARFIFLKRDPLYTAQSIYLARKKMDDTAARWLGPHPIRYVEIKSLTVPEQIVNQIYFTNQTIARQIAQLPPELHTTISYEALTASPELSVPQLLHQIGVSVERVCSNDVFTLKNSNRLRIDSVRADQFNQLIAAGDWEAYTTDSLLRFNR